MRRCKIGSGLTIRSLDVNVDPHFDAAKHVFVVHRHLGRARVSKVSPNHFQNQHRRRNFRSNLDEPRREKKLIGKKSKF